MATSFPPPPPAIPSVATTKNNLFASVDLGTNSFKLLIVSTDPSSGRFLTLNRIKEPVLLGLDTTITTASSTISATSIHRAISALLKFQQILHSHRVPSSNSRFVATSAVREASNQTQFLSAIHESLGHQVEILTGIEEASLIYLGVLQFYPVLNSTVLTIDIGGGSTEFTVGFKGNVLFSTSLKLGHVTLTQNFTQIMIMREHIRKEIEISDLFKKIKEFKIDVVIGSSGTIKAIEKAVCKGYASIVDENVQVFEEFYKREWRFSREELKGLVERLCEEEREIEGRGRREGFFKSRAGFILAGTILLDEIFERLEIQEMEVSGYALGEGVITETLGRVFEGFDLNANARWRSVVRLASRFNNKKRMKAAAICVGIAREIFQGLRKLNELRDNGDNDSDEGLVPLDEADLEYLEAACLLHNIGLCTGKKGYHKQSFRVIMNGNHLHGYNDKEVELIALLVRHHRKKFPKPNSPEGSTAEVKQKFRILCTIIRVSAALQPCLPIDCQNMEFIHSPEGFELVLNEARYEPLPHNVMQPLAGDINSLVEKELEHFRMVFKKKLSIVVSSNTS
ncbi:Metal-dependent phosphohydrolase [Abeliophyllum distichum]|uniref:Metal-dependent phosphohydrolase n=1 Tax=Abeliophyllum distichum TaxID=126358 RepID=A0ABD1RPT0_9LAMI